MDRYIKIFGVCVGMSKSEAWDILKNRSFECMPNSISSIGTVNFCRAQVSVIYMLDETQRIYKIIINWIKKDFKANSLIGKVSLNDINSVFVSFENYFNGIFPSKNKWHSHYNNYVDLYNHVSVVKQDECKDEKRTLIECVHVTIMDFSYFLENKDKELVEFARNSFINRNINELNNKAEIGKQQEPTKEKKHINVNWFKIAIAVILFIIGLLWVQNNRYYYSEKGRIRVDKWKNEWQIYDDGEYVKR